MVESLDMLLSQTLHAEAAVAVATDWKVEEDGALEEPESSPDVVSARVDTVSGINIAKL